MSAIQLYIAGLKLTCGLSSEHEAVYELSAAYYRYGDSVPHLMAWYAKWGYAVPTELVTDPYRVEGA